MTSIIPPKLALLGIPQPSEVKIGRIKAGVVRRQCVPATAEPHDKAIKGRVCHGEQLQREALP